MTFIASTMPKIPDSTSIVHAFRCANRKESDGNITEATVTIREDQHFDLSSSSLTPFENNTCTCTKEQDQHDTLTHEETSGTAPDPAEYIEVPLNDDKGCVYPNEKEDSESKQNQDTTSIKSKRMLYGADAKESHPFFDGRFVEINGKVQINKYFEAHQEITRKRLRRGRRRRPAPVPKRNDVHA